MDKTFLFWKQMTEKTLIHKKAKSMSHFKVFKEMITALLGGKVVGSKLKLFVVWHGDYLKSLQAY